MKIIVFYKKNLNFIKANFINKIILLLLLFFVQQANGEVIFFSRFAGPSTGLGYQCREVKDDFAIKTLKLLENAALPDPVLYDELELPEVIIERPDNIDCMAVLDKQYKHLQNLAMHKGSFSDILLLKHATNYLNELYYCNPFDKEGRLVPLIKANIDNDKPIYPFLLERFRYR